MGLNDLVNTIECPFGANVKIVTKFDDGELYGKCVLASAAYAAAFFDNYGKLREMGCPRPRRGIFINDCMYACGKYVKL